MSGVIRYFPIREDSIVDIESRSSLSNFSFIHDRAFTPASFRDFLALADPLAVLALLAIVAIAVIVGIFLITVWYGGGVVSFARHYAFVKRVASRSTGEVVEYVYSGVKLVLRRHYLRLRETLGCRSCTPRELITKCGKKEYEEFVQLYEDVVYGSKELGPEGEKVLVRLDGSV
ncbi:MAG: hypothetical protein QXU65_04800 [Sulfolobales archaeon]